MPKESACIGPGRGPRERTLSKAQNRPHVGSSVHGDVLLAFRAQAKGLKLSSVGQTYDKDNPLPTSCAVRKESTPSS